MSENVFDASKAKTLMELMEANEKLVKDNRRLRDKIKELERENEEFKKNITQSPT